jgi:hypothetical protein
MKMSFVVVIVSLLVLVGGGGCKKAKVELDGNDLALAAEIGISEAFLLQVKREGQRLYQLKGVDAEGNPRKATGVTIDVPHKEAPTVARRLQNAAPTGWLAFVSERHFGIGGRPDQVSVLKASGFSEVLKVMGTNGWNYNISPEMVIARVEKWDARYGLVLRGAGFDWFEAEFLRPPQTMLEFAKEVYEFCPDVVDQGTGTVEALATEMKRDNTVYLWWD